MRRSSLLPVIALLALGCTTSELTHEQKRGFFIANKCAERLYAVGDECGASLRRFGEAGCDSARFVMAEERDEVPYFPVFPTPGLEEDPRMHCEDLMDTLRPSLDACYAAARRAEKVCMQYAVPRVPRSSPPTWEQHGGADDDPRRAGSRIRVPKPEDAGATR